MAAQQLLPKDFTKQLEKEIKKSVERDAQKHPAKLLDTLIGKPVSEKCKKCGQPKMVIIKGGKAKCTECGYTGKVSVELSWE